VSPRPSIGLNSYGDIGVAATGATARGSRYKARARYRDRTGAYSYVARFGQTKREAEQRLKAALDGLTSAGGGITSAATLTELAAQWLAEDRADRPWSTGTRQHYEYAVKRYVIPQLGELRIREASTSVCDAALRRVTADHGPAAAKTTRAVLNGMFNLAARHDLLPVNPMRETRAVGARSKQARALTEAEVERVTDGLRSDPVAVDFDLCDLVDFMLATGCRIGESLAVRESVIVNDTIEVNATAIRVGGVRRRKTLEGKASLTWEEEEELRALRELSPGLHIQQRPKSAAGWRVLALPPYAVLMLERRAAELRFRAAEGVLFPSPFRPTLRDPSNVAADLRERFDAMDCDHCNRTGYKLDDEGEFVMKRTKKGNLARVRCRLGPFSWLTSHTFRKTVATRLDEAGWSARQIADQLGHAQPSVTLDTYMGRKVVGADAARILDR
jgi:integrase